MKTSNHPIAALALSGVTCLLLLLPACRGERADRASEEALVSGGRASFQAYCASCHGRDGKGNGPVAGQLAVRPADLTRLTVRHGEFPREYVVATIDGRDTLAAHGSRTMPVWGRVWRSDSHDRQQEIEAERVLNELVHYLQSIQVTS